MVALEQVIEVYFRGEHEAIRFVAGLITPSLFVFETGGLALANDRVSDRFTRSLIKKNHASVTGVRNPRVFEKKNMLNAFQDRKRQRGNDRHLGFAYQRGQFNKHAQYRQEIC